MVAGRQGMRLEGLKFGVYVGIPILASAFFNEPETVNYFVDYFRFVEYPANPQTGFREKLEEQAMQRKKLRQQKEEYAKQLKSLDSLVTREKDVVVNDDGGKGRWWRLSSLFGSSERKNAS